MAPDVVALTEPPRGLRGRARLARVAGHAGLTIAVRARTCAVLVRDGLPVTGARAVRMRWTPGLTRRGVATVDVAGVRVLAVHLGLRAAERTRHVDRMVRLVAAAPGPCVVAGDLNEGPSGSSWRALGRALEDLAPGAGPTYPAHAPRVRIDAVLGRGVRVSGGDPRRAGRAPGEEGDVAAPWRQASDHLPVAVDVEVVG